MHDQLAAAFVAGRLSRRDFVRRMIGAGLSVSTVAAVLAACSDDRKPALPDPRHLSGRLQVLIGFSTGLNQRDVQVQQTLAEAFVRKHNDLGVDFIRTADATDAATRLATLLKAGRPPDLVLPIDAADMVRYVDRGTWLNLRKYVKRDGVRVDSMSPLMRSAARAASYFGDSNDDIVGLPLGVHRRALAYNAAIFANNHVDAPPASWSDNNWALDGAFLDVARRLTTTNGQFGAGRLGMSLSYFGFGGRYYDSKARRVLFDRPEAIAGAQFAGDLVNRHKVQAPPDGAVAAWRAGRVAMIELCSCELGTPLTDNLPFEWKLAALPRGPARRYAAADVQLGCIVAASSQHDAAWELLKFLTLDEHNASALMGEIPAGFDDAHASPSTDHATWFPAFDGVTKTARAAFDAVLAGAPADAQLRDLQRTAQANVDHWLRDNHLPG